MRLATIFSALVTLSLFVTVSAAKASGSTTEAGAFPSFPSFPGLPTFPGLPSLPNLPGLPSIPGLPGGPGSGSSTGSSSADGKTMTETYKNSFGSRSYSVFVPTKISSHPGVLVIIHGCFLTGDQMATGTDMNRHAAEKGFIVIYPEQTYQDNPWKCWNWFKPENQERDNGESSIIVGMTQDVIKKYNVDTTKVIVSGISAGGAMTSNLLGCYNDVFTGGLVESGLEFAAAQTEDEAHTASSDGPKHDMDAIAKQALKCSPARKSLVPVIVVHGKADPYVNPINGDRTALIFEKLNTLIYTQNGGNASAVTHKETKQAAVGQQYSATYSDTLYDGQLIVRKVMVDGMGHGWSGGKATAPYMEPRGVDASQMIVDTFFAN